MASSKPVCRFFVKGNCRFGDSCRDSHNSTPGTNPASSIPNKMPRAPPKPSRDQQTVQKAMKNAGRLITTISPTSTSQETVKEVIKLKNYQHLTSYNWKDSKEPTIYVPGSPPKWTPHPPPHHIPADAGLIYIDQNTSRLPHSPFAPLFAALKITQPDFNLASIDLITDRNNLRKMLKFVSGQARDSWRIDIDVVGETMFFSRWDVETKMVVNGEQGRGHEFEKAFTEWEQGLEESTSHHRIVKYNLGGLECVVRFEVDACVSDEAASMTSKDHGAGIEAAFEGLSLDSDGKGKEKSNTQESSTATEKSSPSISHLSKDIKVIYAGTPIPPTSIAELKSTTRPSILAHHLIPQLYLSQTHNLFVAHHKDGLISQPVERQDMRGKMAKWEIENAGNLGELVRVIKELKGAVKAMGKEGEGGGRGMLVFERGKGLKLFARNGKGLVLGEGVRERCWRGREA